MQSADFENFQLPYDNLVSYRQKDEKKHTKVQSLTEEREKSSGRNIVFDIDNNFPTKYF